MPIALEEGTKLSHVWGPQNDEGISGATVDSIGAHCYRAKSIVVVTVAGQCGRVPWAQAEMNDGRTELFNLALMEQVGLLMVKALEERGWWEAGIDEYPTVDRALAGGG